MNILIIDQDKVGLPYAMRCLAAGHRVKMWQSLDKGDIKSRVGEGLVDQVASWRPHMGWADLIVLTDNSKHRDELEPYFTKGFPIIGANKRSGELELNREVGQRVLEECGIPTLPFKTFTSYDRAIQYVKSEGRPFVSKPWGGNPDKSLSYVPKTAEDLISQLQTWKRLGLKGEFMLQEMVKGYEMAVGAWFGPGGWSKWKNENWEEKRLMNGGLGPNTGEMGTVMRYTKDSALFDEVLKPCTKVLNELGYVGYVDVNCMEGSDGTPWPLEFTMRFGWPHFNLCMALHKGDPAQWMLDLVNGRDSLECSEDVCVGVVMAMGDYPWDFFDPEKNQGHPIRGLTKSNADRVYLTSARWGTAPCKRDGKIVDEECMVSSGSYVLITTGAGDDVQEAQEEVYGLSKKIYWPPHRIYRTDIGCRLEEDLPKLQAFGFAAGMRY